ncbi:MAG: hypothetical protein HQ562_03440 [Candidatus Marinimicrobia bacterium]|nr:hypothetical protein [Candidatus Neomarinimicrobiota bacterium]
MKKNNYTLIVVKCVFLAIVLQAASLFAQGTAIKVKTVPDFPEGLPPTPIIWSGVQIGYTNPGEAVTIVIDLGKEKVVLKVGEAEMNLWGSGLGIKGEVLSGNVKMKKGPVLTIKSKLSPSTILANALEYHKVFTDSLNAPDISTNQKIKFSGLLSKIYNYDFKTEDISSSITGVDNENGLVFLEFSYFSLIEKTWQDTLKVMDSHFSGKKPATGAAAQVLADSWSKIPKYGTLKISRDGELDLVSVKTEKYKWGTYKKNKKTKKKCILPITFYAK